MTIANGAHGDGLALDVDGLQYAYPDGTQSLRGLSLRIEPGELFDGTHRLVEVANDVETRRVSLILMVSTSSLLCDCQCAASRPPTPRAAATAPSAARPPVARRAMSASKAVR